MRPPRAPPSLRRRIARLPSPRFCRLWPQMTQALMDRGITGQDLANVMGESALRVLKAALGDRHGKAAATTVAAAAAVAL